MKLIERLKKDARASVTTSDLFRSSAMKELIGAKLRYICKMFRVACPDLSISYDETSSMTAATNLQNLIVNAGHPMFDGDDEHRFLKVAGVILHEAGHVLFTNYTAYWLWEKDIKDARYWPRQPEVTPDLEVSRDRLPELCKSPLLRGALIKYAGNLSNCLEDGRIEGLIMRYIRNIRFMMKGLTCLRQETYAEMMPFEDLVAKVDAGEWKTSTAILQLTVHYARFGSVKGDFDPGTELGALFERIMPEIDDYLAAKEAVVYYEAFNRILIIMEETLENELKDAVDKMKQQMSQEQTGGGQSQGQSGQSQGNGTGEGSADGSPAADESESSEGSGGSSESSQDQQDSGCNGDSTDEKDESDDSDGSEGQSPIPDGSDMEEDELLKAAEELQQQMEQQVSQVEGQTADNSEALSESKGSDRGSVSRTLSGLAKAKAERWQRPPEQERPKEAAAFLTKRLRAATPALPLRTLPERSLMKNSSSLYPEKSKANTRDSPEMSRTTQPSTEVQT